MALENDLALVSPMKRLLFVAVLCFLFLTFSCLSIYGIEEKSKTDESRLQGTWIMVSAYEGTKTAEGEVGEKWTFKGDRLLEEGSKDFKYTNSRTVITFYVKFKLVPTKQPKEINLELIARKLDRESGVLTDPSPEDSISLRGIYKLEKDKLTFCFADDEKKRPTKLVPQENCYFVVLKRAKPKEAPQKNKERCFRLRHGRR